MTISPVYSCNFINLLDTRPKKQRLFNFLNKFSMDKLSRRQFLAKSALGIGSAVIALRLPLEISGGSLKPPVKMPLGFQSWIIREKIDKDFRGAIKTIADMGYQSIEMCSPAGYETLGFGSLLKIINDAGLIWSSTHYGMDELRQHPDERIEFARESGQEQMVLSSFGLEKNATISDWLKAADELNIIGAKSKKSGIQMGYHNHHTEFEKIGDTLIYDALMSQLDPEAVKMQFQVAVISAGFKASDYFKRYPGRFISAHLADWSDTEKKNVPLGKGIVDWKEFFASLKTGGVQNIFVEMGEETFKESADYIHSL
jgi:sugar phosphate isomerase/epimerase